MKIGLATITGAEKLKSKGNESANLEAEIFLSSILGKSREFLFAHPEANLNFLQKFKFNRMIDRRIKGVPVAYLTGHKEFYGFDFVVDKNVLIPRPETELMINRVLESTKTQNIQYPLSNIIDIGTGSGCIIVTLAKLLGRKYSNLNFYGLDISRKALKVAKRNAKKNGIAGRIQFLYSDLLNNIDKNIFNKSVLVTANLPYLAPEQIKTSPTIQKEPKIALLGGVDGLDCYRRLFRQIKEIFTKFGQEIILFCEIDEAQTERIKKTINIEFPAANLEFIKDLNGFDRIVKVKLYR